MPYIQLGVDYGTSATKVVARDFDAPGGTKCFPVLWESTDPYGEYRLPSTIRTHGAFAWFGISDNDCNHYGVPGDAAAHTSIKMRVARQVAGNNERVRLNLQGAANLQLPDGWGYKELFIASLSWTLCKSMRWVLASRQYDVRDTSFGVTFGMPNDFRDDRLLARLFYNCFRAAYAIASKPDLAQKLEEFRVNLSIEFLDHIRTEFDNANQLDMDDAAFWMQSEALSSAYWTWDNPELTAGPYFHIDVGAGTSNVSAYLVFDEIDPVTNARHNTGISIYASKSGPIGLNAFLNDPERILERLRADDTINNQLLNAYREVFRTIRRMTTGEGRPWDQWRNARVILLGGGTRVNAIADSFLFHPYHRDYPPEPLRLINFPRDFDDTWLGNVPQSQYRRLQIAGVHANLAIAYGLSAGTDLPVEQHMNDHPLAALPRRTRDDFVDIYAR